MMALHFAKSEDGTVVRPRWGAGLRIPSATLLALVTLCPGAPAGESVTITGGADDSGFLYTWTITHRHTAPIVYVAFPHFRANFFTPPPGWEVNITHRLSLDGKVGRCTARAHDPAMGIQRGQPVRFTLSISPDGTPRGEGDVLVRFADGTEAVVRAQVPVKESAGAQNLSLIGLGTIFGVFLLVRAIRRRRRQD